MRGLGDAEKLAFAIADNKITTNAGWDRSLLSSQLGELASLLPATSTSKSRVLNRLRSMAC
jgi:hypothetical protein